MSRDRGDRRSSRNGAAPRPLLTLAELTDYLTKNLFTYIEPDSRTESGGLVTSFVDKVTLVGNVAPNARTVDPAHALAQASVPAQVGVPATDAAFNSQVVSTFAGAQFYDSSIGPANFDFCHNGTGFEEWVVYGLTNGASGRSLLSTGTGSGVALGHSLEGYPNSIIGNGTVRILDVAPGALQATTATPVVYNLRYSETDSPEYSQKLTGNVAITGSSAGAPSATTSAATLRLGRIGGGAFGSFKFAGYYLVNRKDLTLRANMARYLLVKFGVVV